MLPKFASCFATPGRDIDLLIQFNSAATKLKIPYGQSSAKLSVIQVIWVILVI